MSTVVQRVLLCIALLIIPIAAVAIALPKPSECVCPIVPTDGPSDDYRRFHPANFSWVTPRCWIVRIYWAGNGSKAPGLRAFSVDGKPEKIGAYLEVFQLPQAPQIPAGAQIIDFQGERASLTVRHRRKEWFGHPGQLDAELFFQRGGAWWTMRYTIFEDRSEVPAVMWQYMESFALSKVD